MDESSAFFRSTLTRGGFSGAYSLDLSNHHGEVSCERHLPSQIWIELSGSGYGL